MSLRYLDERGPGHCCVEERRRGGDRILRGGETEKGRISIKLRRKSTVSVYVWIE